MNKELRFVVDACGITTVPFGRFANGAESISYPTKY